MIFRITRPGAALCRAGRGSGGYLGLVEAIRQVTGQAGGTQVADARRAMVSGFGMINYDRGVCSAAAIIEGSGR
ncbi:hypothetical protein ACFQDZ_19695 [Sulfitobacter pacificus]|uniref:thiolase C-terminal domain-containing protein n=1 Tax=Sulfitobacter pacificus TaxID=1499314 RepID=UPI00361C4A3B